MRHRRAQSQHADRAWSAVPHAGPPGASIPEAFRGGESKDEQWHCRGREQTLRGANSLSKLRRRHSHSHSHELRAKEPLAHAASHETQIPMRQPDVPVSAGAGGGLFSREARQRRRRAGSAPASTPDGAAAVFAPPPLTPRSERESPPRSRRNHDGQDPSPTRPALSRDGASADPVPPITAWQQVEGEEATPADPEPVVVVDHPLFKPSFSRRQLKRFERAAHRVEVHDRKQLRKGTIGAEVKVAMGVLEYIEIERRNKQKLHGHSRRGSAPPGGAGGGSGLLAQTDLGGLVRELESQVAGRIGSERREGATAPASEERPGRERARERERGRVGASGKQVLAGMGGAAAVAGLVGAAGYEWWQHRHGHERREGTARPAGDHESEPSHPLPLSKFSAFPLLLSAFTALRS